MFIRYFLGNFFVSVFLLGSNLKCFIYSHFKNENVVVELFEEERQMIDDEDTVLIIHDSSPIPIL